MKIFRFEKIDHKNKDSFQYFMINNCTLPCFDKDIVYILNELPEKEKKYWKFGFTKKQFIHMCKWTKKYKRFHPDKILWNKNIRLSVYEVKEKYVFEFKGQVLFDKRHVK